MLRLGGRKEDVKFDLAHKYITLTTPEWRERYREAVQDKMAE